MQILSSHLGTPWSHKIVINKLWSILLKALEKSTKARRIEWGRLFGRSPILYMNSKSLDFVTPYLSTSFLANPATPMLLILCKTSFTIRWSRIKIEELNWYYHLNCCYIVPILSHVLHKFSISWIPRSACHFRAIFLWWF